MRQAFTLAETLVTLGIIGVVAALTLPNVMSNYKTKTYIAQLQKFYNQLSTAVSSYTMDQEVDDLEESELLTVDGVEEFLKKYFRVTKDCGVGEDGLDCLAPSYKSIDKNEETSPNTADLYCISLNTGASVCMGRMLMPEDEEDSESEEHGASFIMVDLNGKNKPNIAGRDFFGFYLYSDGKISESYTPTTGDLIDRCLGTDGTSYGGHCFDKVLSDGWKMDY